MALLEIQIPQTRQLNSWMTLFALGFRQLFLVAGFSAIILLGLWMLIYHGAFTAPAYYGAVAWHGHEMLFGYTMAVVAGFLLTAIKNWTSIQTPRNSLLAGLVFLWLSERIAPFLSPWLSPWVIALVDISFLPMLALGLVVTTVANHVYRAYRHTTGTLA